MFLESESANWPEAVEVIAVFFTIAFVVWTQRRRSAEDEDEEG